MRVNTRHQKHGNKKAMNRKAEKTSRSRINTKGIQNTDDHSNTEKENIAESVEVTNSSEADTACNLNNMSTRNNTLNSLASTQLDEQEHVVEMKLFNNPHEDRSVSFPTELTCLKLGIKLDICRSLETFIIVTNRRHHLC